MHNPLPREIAPDIFWLGGCLPGMFEGKPFHSYQSAFLIRGDKESLLVEAGHPKDLPVIERQLAQVLGGSELKYVFTTHQETPHAGGIGWWLDRYPGAVLTGDVAEYRLILPEYADRIVPVPNGHVIDLGNAQFEVVDAIIKDLDSTQWGLERKRRALFSGDGFAYGHYHEDGQCGCLAEEADSLKIPQMTSVFAEFALYWTRFSNIEPYIRDLEIMLRDRDVALICPTHGLPISDVARTLPKIAEGLRIGSTSDIFDT